MYFDILYNCSHTPYLKEQNSKCFLKKNNYHVYISFLLHVTVSCNFVTYITWFKISTVKYYQVHCRML